MNCQRGGKVEEVDGEDMVQVVTIGVLFSFGPILLRQPGNLSEHAKHGRSVAKDGILALPRNSLHYFQTMRHCPGKPWGRQCSTYSITA